MSKDETAPSCHRVEISENVVDAATRQRQSKRLTKLCESRRTVEPDEGTIQAIRVILDVIRNDRETSLFEMPSDCARPGKDVEKPFGFRIYK